MTSDIHKPHLNTLKSHLTQKKRLLAALHVHMREMIIVLTAWVRLFAKMPSCSSGVALGKILIPALVV